MPSTSPSSNPCQAPAQHPRARLRLPFSEAPRAAPAPDADPCRELEAIREQVAEGEPDAIVVLEGGRVRTVQIATAKPLSPWAWRERTQAERTKAQIGERFCRAFTGKEGGLGWTPFTELTDAGGVRVHQLRLLAGIARFKRSLAEQGGGTLGEFLAPFAFSPETWDKADTREMYRYLETSFLGRVDEVAAACVRAARQAPPGTLQGPGFWRDALLTAVGHITVRRRPSVRQPEPVGSSPKTQAPTLASRQDAKYPLDEDPPRRGADATPRKVMPAGFQAASPGPGWPPLPALEPDPGPEPDHKHAPLRRPSGPAGMTEARMRQVLARYPLYGALVQAPDVPELAEPAPGREQADADLSRVGAALMKLPTYPLRAEEVDRTDAPDPMQTKRRDCLERYRQAYQDLQDLHGRLAPLTSPLSDPFRDQVRRWPLEVRASLLRYSAERVRAMDPGSPAWRSAYRLHAELARAVLPTDCFSEEDEALERRTREAVERAVRERQDHDAGFPQSLAAVEQVFRAARADRSGASPFTLASDPLKRRGATYHPSSHQIVVGPELPPGRTDFAYVLRHVAAASIHDRNQHLVRQLAAGELQRGDKRQHIASMLLALQEVPVSVAMLARLGVPRDQAERARLSTLAKQRELRFARAVGQDRRVRQPAAAGASIASAARTPQAARRAETSSATPAVRPAAALSTSPVSPFPIPVVQTERVFVTPVSPSARR